MKNFKDFDIFLRKLAKNPKKRPFKHGPTPKMGDIRKNFFDFFKS